MKRKIIYIGNKLAAKGATVTSIETLGEFLRSENVEVITASDKRNKILRLLDMLKTVYSNSKKADFVLIDTYSTSNFWYAFLIAKLCKNLSINYIPILRGGNLPHRLKISPRASHFIFRNAQVNIAPSGFLMEEFSKAGFSNLKFIPNSIDLQHYKFKMRENIKPKLLWVRAFSEVYNPILAIKIFESLRKTHSEAELCMVGPTKDDSFLECKNYAESNNLPVTFTGKLDKSEWIKLSESYDIFLNTTNYDNTPVSVIEAMALGMPVISTDVGGIPYLLTDKHDALLVSPRSLKDFVDKIHFILKSPENALQMTHNARQKAESFDWKVVKEDWMQIIR
ncbi:MAG TPA: glycosyltransferase family 4 protein [Salinimicrobium sp.]|nr:glycosyltransferase family 4 protein [Salinimicrobium sp.]